MARTPEAEGRSQRSRLFALSARLMGVPFSTPSGSRGFAVWWHEVNFRFESGSGTASRPRELSK